MTCPQCRMVLEHGSSDMMECLAGHRYPRRDGIWRFMTPEDEAKLQPFMTHYERVRREEGRGAAEAAYYRELPFRDLTGAYTFEWRIRARSFQSLLDNAVKPIEVRADRPLRIIDLGAGSGWLSYRLALRGHEVAAVDLQTGLRDGLGAHVHYDAPFLPVQAHYERLPFGDGVFDLAVFNASLHYAASGRAAIGEALRVLAPGGGVAILDSPIYEEEAHGAAMAAESAARYCSAGGAMPGRGDHGDAARPQGAFPSRPYLTFAQLAFLGAHLQVRWEVHRPTYGLRWLLRPWIARLLRRRPPAQFAVVTGRRTGATSVDPPEIPRPPLPPRLLPIWHVLLRRRFRYFQRHRHDRLVIEEVAGRCFLVLPGVFNPRLFHSGALFAGSLSSELVPTDAAVLDVGSGSGVIAVTAAAWAGHVDAVDINPAAVRCTRLNALMHGVEGRISTHVGDLFAPVKGRRFDVVLFNPPYYRGRPANLLDAAFRAVDVVERFAAGLADHMTDRGYALVVLSTEGDAPAFLRSFSELGYRITPLRSRRLPGEVLTLYLIARTAS